MGKLTAVKTILPSRFDHLCKTSIYNYIYIFWVKNIYIQNVTGLPLYANGTTGTLLLLDETLVRESERIMNMIAIGLLS